MKCFYISDKCSTFNDFILFILSLEIDSLEKLKGLREVSNSIYNDKVDILNISMNKELLSIEDIIAINKAINIVSDDLSLISLSVDS